jgi:hypothetical protein
VPGAGLCGRCDPGPARLSARHGGGAARRRGRPGRPNDHTAHEAAGAAAYGENTRTYVLTPAATRRVQVRAGESVTVRFEELK